MEPQMPHNKESEACLLGALIINNDHINAAITKVSVDSFFLGPHRLIWKALERSHKKFGSVDLVILKDELGDDVERIGGMGYVMSLVDNTPHDDPTSYIAHVLEKQRLREAVTSAQDILHKAASGASADDLYRIADKIKASQKADDKFDLAQCSEATMSNIGAIRREGIDLLTGWRGVDDCIGGIRRGNLYTVGGKTSQGKTSVAVNIAYNNLVSNPTCKILYNGFENIDQFSTRLAAIESGVSLSWFLKPNLISEEEYGRVVEAMEKIKQYKDRVVVMNSASVNQMRAVCDNFHPDIIFVDYLQRYAHRHALAGEGRLSHEIGKVVSDLQDLAIERKSAVFNFSQFSRRSEEQKGRRPIINDLKESGDIENYSDVILLLWWSWRDDLSAKKNPEDYSILVEKNKLGPCGNFSHKITPDTLAIENWPLEKKDN